MRTYDSISFDTRGLVLQGEKDGARVWWNEVGDGVGLYYFDKPPDIEADLHCFDDVRQLYRIGSIANGFGIIEVETPQIDSCLAVRIIIKIPRQPHGMTYVGSITLPFRDFSYVLKVQWPETGTTGIREAVISAKMLSSGQIKIQKTGDGPPQLLGWCQDPYDSTISGKSVRNVAEDEQYDAQFPDHPLSRLRSILRKVEPSLRLVPEVRNAPPFVFVPRPGRVVN